MLSCRGPNWTTKALSIQRNPRPKIGRVTNGFIPFAESAGVSFQCRGEREPLAEHDQTLSTKRVKFHYCPSRRIIAADEIFTAVQLSTCQQQRRPLDAIPKSTDSFIKRVTETKKRVAQLQRKSVAASFTSDKHIPCCNALYQICAVFRDFPTT